MHQFTSAQHMRLVYLLRLQGGQIAAAGMGMPQLAFYPNFQMPAGMAAYTAPTISGMDTMGGVAIGSMPMGSMPMGNMGIGGLAPAAGGQFAAQAMQVSPCQTP